MDDIAMIFGLTVLIGFVIVIFYLIGKDHDK